MKPTIYYAFRTGICAFFCSFFYPMIFFAVNPIPPKGFLRSPENPQIFLGGNLNGLAGSGYFTQNYQVNIDAGNDINDFAPVVTTFGSNIYVVWNGDESVKSIFFARSMDGGSSFSIPVKINDNVTYPPGFSVYGPDIVVDSSGVIYVVWFDYRAWTGDSDFSSPVDVYLDKSMDGGLTWSNDVQVTNGSGSFPWHFQPYLDIHRSTGNLYVTFTDYDRYAAGELGDISFVRSIDDGVTFSSKIRVDDNGEFSPVTQLFSGIAVNQNTGRIYVAFQDNRNGDFDIYITSSADEGISFGTNNRVHQETSQNQEEPTVAVHPLDGTVLVAWKDWRADLTPAEAPYENHIYIAHSLNNGSSFEMERRITDQFMDATIDFNFPPDLAIDSSGFVYVVWHDRRTGFSRVYYDQSLDGGLSFGMDMPVGTDMNNASQALPRIALNSLSESLFVWMDRRNSVTTNWDIYMGGSALEICPANLDLSGPVANGFYAAGVGIRCNGVFAGNQDLILSAGSEISMMPEWEVVLGSKLEVIIASCQVPSGSAP